MADSSEKYSYLQSIYNYDNTEDIPDNLTHKA